MDREHIPGAPRLCAAGIFPAWRRGSWVLTPLTQEAWGWTSKAVAAGAAGPPRTPAELVSEAREGRGQEMAPAPLGP